MIHKLMVGALSVMIIFIGVAVQAQTVEERLTQLERELAELKAARLNDPSTFRLYWKDGIRFDTADGAFKMKLGGRIQNDWVWQSLDEDLENQVGDTEDGTEFRRARLAISGTAYKVLEYKAQYDFAGDDVDFKDVYVGHKNLPGIGGGLRIGHFKEPFGLEELTSSKHITFMERSLTSPFAPSRNSGAMYHRRLLADSTQVQVGFFRDVDDFGFDTDDAGYAITARLAALPVYANNGTTLVHAGVATTHRNLDGVRFRQRPDTHISNRYVNTGNLAIDSDTRVGFELAAVMGPFSMQGEFMYATQDLDGGGDTHFNAFYVMASYFITGESRPYKKEGAMFSNVKPRRNAFDGDGGIGAWEAAVRLSRLDLDENVVQGGELSTFTAGLNWYLNPNYRVSWNYVRAHLASADDADIFQMRLQVAW